MNMSTGGWSAAGVIAAVAIAAGIVLLIAYAIRTGLVHGDLPDTEPQAGVASRIVAARAGGRWLGTIGAIALVAGLALGLYVAWTGWGTGAGTGDAPGLAPNDCAQSWSGCGSESPAP